MVPISQLGYGRQQHLAIERITQEIESFIKIPWYVALEGSREGIEERADVV